MARSHDVDKHIGQRIRTQRLLLGMTLKQLADAIALSYQQVQRYESGADHIACHRLNEIAMALQVSPGAFFPTNSGAALTNVNGVVSLPSDELSALVDRPDCIKLLRAFRPLSGNRRAMLIEMVETYTERLGKKRVYASERWPQQ